MTAEQHVHRASRAWLLSTLLVLGACSGETDASSLPAPPLMLLVTVDTLRADRLGAYGNPHQLTPALDALAQQSVLFERAYAASSFTLPSVASLLTGRYPEELGIRDNESGVPAGVPTLAHTLHVAGWKTGAVVSNFVLRASTGLASGFDIFDDEFTEAEAIRGWPERVGPDTTLSALHVLDALRPLPSATETPPVTATQPVFLWVHYQDPHGPYTPPTGARDDLLTAAAASPYGSRNLEVRQDTRGLGGIPDYQYLEGRKDAAFYLAGYDAEVRETDRAIGALFDGLRARGLFDEALILFGADHGEGLGEDDYWFAHGELLSDSLVNVPLMLRIPGRPPERRHDVASLVDVMPTVLDLLGLPFDTGEQSAPGRALFSGGTGRAYMATLGGALVPKFALVEGEHKFVLTREGNGWKGQLFERRRGEAESPRASGELGPSMRRHLKQLQKRFDVGIPETRQELGDAEIEALRALGYTGREGQR